VLATTTAAFDLWKWINDSGSGIGAVAGVAAAVIAIWGIVKATRDNRARSQPAMSVELRLAEDSDSTVDLVVRNIGPTTARDVTITFDPPIVIPPTGGPYSAPAIVQRYRDPIPAIAPGVELRNIWWAGRPGSGNKMINGEPTPDNFTVSVSYRGLGKGTLSDEFPLRVEVMTLTTYSVSSTSLKGMVKLMTQSLSKIASKM